MSVYILIYVFLFEKNIDFHSTKLAFLISVFYWQNNFFYYKSFIYIVNLKFFGVKQIHIDMKVFILKWNLLHWQGPEINKELQGLLNLDKFSPREEVVGYLENSILYTIWGNLAFIQTYGKQAKILKMPF